jgi:hypothetical protein
MRTSTHRRFARLWKILLGSALLAALEVAFAALTVTENTAPSLGTLLGGVTGRNFILNTDATVSGTDAADYLFGAVAGSLTIKQTGGAASANILADNFTSASGDLDITGVPCKWHTDAATTCDGSGINVTLQGPRTLLVGVDLKTVGSHSGGDSPTATYDITVTLL